MKLQLPPILDFGPRSNPSNGTLFDMRDGQSYKVVKIGKQIWLAENFRYLPSIEKGDKYENSWVYDNDNSYLEKGYGRLYDWNTANSIAPEGWKLPSNKDFQELIDFIRKDNNLITDEDKVGSYLKSIDGWEPCEEIVNNDKYGFNAKPAGNCTNVRDYKYNGYFSFFWSATGGNYSCPRYLVLDNSFSDYDGNSGSSYKRYNGFSVRLVKD